MHITFVIFCFFSSSFAWLLPERCEQGKSSRVRGTLIAAATKNAGMDPNIEDIAAQQHALLMKTYRDHQFYGIPIRSECDSTGSHLSIHAPYNCTFHTYGPRLLSSVACPNTTACKLTHTVSTVDTYSSAEGYNWGVKISTKASFLKIFEVGGEVSTGGTYTCSYTKGRTTSDTVECAVSSGKGGHLQLYNVKSDMECDFGRITLDIIKSDTIGGNRGYFTESELTQIADSAATRFEPYCYPYMIDTNKISDRLFQKIMKEAPLFNPYTDLVYVDYFEGARWLDVWYMKETEFVQEYRRIIPFTTEGGDAVFQYACMLTLF